MPMGESAPYGRTPNKRPKEFGDNGPNSADKRSKLQGDKEENAPGAKGSKTGVPRENADPVDPVENGYRLYCI